MGLAAPRRVERPLVDVGEEGVRRLVDLPGYGYAKVPKAVKDAWNRQLEAYLSERQSLRGLVLLSECPRCDHRWTRSLGGILRFAREPMDAIPHAA
mgnify:CR=1 FL=1